MHAGRIGMQRQVYQAAECGTVDILRSHNNWKQQNTPIGNNVLHIQVGNPLDIHRGVVLENVNLTFIQYVLDETADNSALLQTNDKGDTPLHLAARFGHTKAVQEFLRWLEVVNDQGVIDGLLSKANKRKDTALHEATRAGLASIVKLLVEAGGENALQHLPNKLGETPLFLAAEGGYADLFATIIRHTALLALEHRGPCGQSALHATVMCGNKDIVDMILEKGTGASLIRIQNDQGQTALHCCAARDGKKQRSILRALLDNDDEYNSAAYIQDNEGRTALHIATLNLNFEVAKMLICSYPDCIEMVDNKEQNVVHYAANSGCLNTFELFLRKLPKCEKLINEKDYNGNTPLHLLVATTPSLPIHGCFFKLPIWLKRHGRLDLRAFNDQNLTAGDIIASNDNLHHLAAPKQSSKILPRGRRTNNGSEREETTGNVEKKKHSLKRVEERISNLRKAGETRLVVAALIATVSFTAGFAVPGGFNQIPGADMGLAVLAKGNAFIVFLISDAIAFTLSSLAVICYFSVASQGDLMRLERLSTQAHLLNSISLGALMIAFVSGVYAVVSRSPSLAFTTIAISLFYFFIYLNLLFGSCGQVLAFITRHATIHTHVRAFVSGVQVMIRDKRIDYLIHQ